MAVTCNIREGKARSSARWMQLSLRACCTFVFYAVHAHCARRFPDNSTELQQEAGSCRSYLRPAIKTIADWARVYAWLHLHDFPVIAMFPFYDFASRKRSKSAISTRWCVSVGCSALCRPTSSHVLYKPLSVCRGYKWNKIISKLFQPSSTSVWNNFISARGNLPEIISQVYCCSLIFSKMFNVAEVILK